MSSIKTTSLIELFLKNVFRFPDRSALWVENKFYTYRSLYERAMRLAETIKHFNAERCVILSKRNITAYSAIIATLLADKTYVPLNPNYPVNANLNFLEAIDTDLLIVDTALSDYAKKMADEIKRPVIFIFQEPNYTTVELEKTHHQIVYVNTQCFFKYPVFKNSYAYLLFTSGSTGKPKGILVSHQNALTYVENMVCRSKPCETDRFSQLADLTFDFSVHDLFVAWAVGACVYSVSSQHLIHWQQFMDQHRLTFWASVPSTILFLQQIGQLESASLSSLHYSVFCGEVLSNSLAALWKKAAPNSSIDNLYGPTEAAVACTGFLWQPNLLHNECVPIGFPFPQLEYRILNEKNESVSQGEIGELCLAGPQVVSHYWRNPLLTEQRFFRLESNGQLWYRTRDLVMWDEKVGFIFKGRLDDQLKIRGRCVMKLEIELALQKIAETPSVAILPWPIAKNTHVETMVAFVSHTRFTVEDLLKKARETLPEYRVPTQIIKLAALPLNSNGKIDYSQLERLL